MTLDPDLAQLQQDLQAAIIANDDNATEQHRAYTAIANQPPLNNKERLLIYQNAYRIRLRETLDTDHEILGIYLGDELYDQLVEGYTTAFPSVYRSLRHFADHLPGFLASTLPFSNYPIISELAHFERCLMTAFDAPDIERMTRESLTQVPENDWPSLHLRFHPSVQLFAAEWNSVDIWQALKTTTVPPEPLNRHGHWLIWRNSERLTEFRSLNGEELALISLIIQGTSFAGLCEQLLESYAQEIVPSKSVTYLNNWIISGLLRRPTLSTLS